jgi:serine/threonine protein kinase
MPTGDPELTIRLDDAATVPAGASTPAEAPAVGRVLPFEIDGLRLIAQLGAGGMGVVYEAEQLSPRRRVAVKMMKGGFIVDDHHLRLFRREIDTLGRLVHPNIAAIHGAGRMADGTHYFTMELVPGLNLQEYAVRELGGDAPRREHVRERLRLFGLVCDAVQYAHQRGVIHRDLKPQNVLVTLPMDGSASSPSGLGAGGQVKVLDFGLARIVDDAACRTATGEGLVQGTLAYMSPEQVEGLDLDVRSDVYSLGVMLYQLIAGRLPYAADTAGLVGKALEKSPDQRYASAAALVEDLRRYLVGQPILAHPPSWRYQAGTRGSAGRAASAWSKRWSWRARGSATPSAVSQRSRPTCSRRWPRPTLAWASTSAPRRWRARPWRCGRRIRRRWWSPGRGAWSAPSIPAAASSRKGRRPCARRWR